MRDRLISSVLADLSVQSASLLDLSLRRSRR